MDDDILKWLTDAKSASKNIQSFLETKSFQDYQNDLLLRSGVERQFEIVGEAIRRIREKNPALLEDIEGWRGAISFRNILAHGYDSIAEDIVWGIIEDDLPELLDGLNKLLDKNK